MMIIKNSYSFSGKLLKRTKTDFIILHHAAASSCSPGQIHSIHKNTNGWAGIGYHFYIRKDGSIHTGRPIDTVGSHAENYNSKSVGVCFEGNFETEKMGDAQMQAGKWLMDYLKSMYPKAVIKKHRDFDATACPGKNFPFDAICKGEITDIKDIINELSLRGIMTNPALWMKKCKEDVNAYHLSRKICNLTKKSSERTSPLESVNDIVWELHKRGVITDKNLWLKKFKEDTNLYWLGYKAANMTKNN